ncbi:MAG: hypothetical protein R2838_02085 [Caldilineaceae bacterium]
MSPTHPHRRTSPTSDQTYPRDGTRPLLPPPTASLGWNFFATSCVRKTDYMTG